MASAPQQMSKEQAVELLNGMSGMEIERLKRLHATFTRLPHQGKHNTARALRAQARIAKRKAKRKA